MSYENLEQELLQRYKQITETIHPEWAVHKRNTPTEIVKPSIPFIGKNYAKQGQRILVYASAENLADYWKGNDEHWTGDWLDDNELAMKRHRYCFDTPKFQKDRFFPHVHIGPLNDGYLAMAVYYLAEKINADANNLPSRPRDFYETICVANFCKFSIETELQENVRNRGIQEGAKENVDYTRLKAKEAREKLSASMLYLKADIDILKPDIVILPQTLYNICKKAYDEIKGDVKIIPIYQINSRVVNCTINRKWESYQMENLSPAVSEWYTEFNKDSKSTNYLSVFSYLDKKIEEIITK